MHTTEILQNSDKCIKIKFDIIIYQAKLKKVGHEDLFTPRYQEKYVFTFQYFTQGHTFLESPPNQKFGGKKQGAHLLLSCEIFFFIYTLKRKQTKKFGFFLH